MLVGCEPAANAYTTDPEYRYSVDYAHGCLSGTDYDTGLVPVVFHADLTYSVKTGIITIDPSDDSRKPDLYFTGLADGSRPLQPVDAMTRQVLLENSCPGLS